MTLPVEPGDLLESEGIAAAECSGICPSRPLYEEAVRRGEGVDRRRRAAGLPDRPAHRPVAERQVPRPRALERSAHRLGRGQPADGAGAVRRAAPRHPRVAGGQRAVRAGLLRRRRPAVPPADPRHHRVRLAQPVRPQPVHRRSRPRRRRRSGAEPFTVIDAPSFKADPARHGTASEVVIALNFARAAGAHRRHELRRRDQEVDLQRPELPAAAAGRAADALLGQRRRRRATWRCSSGCRAPARRRCRAIPSGG